ncbi:MAG: DNA polymerase III subunit beta [bacterium]
MELSISREAFLKEVQKIQSITPIKGTKPILSSFLLEATGEGIYMSATDLDVGLKILIDADVADKGSICLPARVVYDIVRELPEKSSISMKLEENNRLRLQCLHSVFHVPGIAADEFPPLPELDAKKLHPIDLKVLLDMIVKVNVAVPAVEQKLYNAPAGALFSISDKGIESVGTDGHRMAYIYTEEIGLPFRSTMVLPKKLLDELPKILTDWEKGKEKGATAEDSEKTVKIGLTGNHCVFSLPNIQFFARLLEHKFPDYKGPITVENDKRAIIDRERFRQAVRRVSLITEKREWFILFKLAPGSLTLDSESAEVGDAHDEIEIEYQGEPLEIGFNPKYILDFLGVIDGTDVVLEMSDNESLAIMKPHDNENVKFIIMPVRL